MYNIITEDKRRPKIITPSPKELLSKSPLARKFVARQPIFDQDKNLFGYELLFRSGLDNFFDYGADKDSATSQILLDGIILFGIKELTGGKRGFINFTQNMLLNRIPFSFPRDFLVVEMLETIKPTRELMAICEKLKYDGYLLALDDFHFKTNFTPLYPYLDFIKVDFMQMDVAERTRVIRQADTGKIKFLAEKVETIEDFRQALKLGYHYFQGYFFSAPHIMAMTDIPSVKANLLRLLEKIQQPDIAMPELERIIKRDVSLSFKLIRFINSAIFGLPVEVNSILHALNLLGIHELRRWVSMLALSQLSDDKPMELMTASVIRARFSECIGLKLGLKERSPELFLMGLFSLIDTFVERPMADILSEMPLARDIKDALLEKKGNFGVILKLAVAYERGEWDTIFTHAAELNLPPEHLPEIYLGAILWANALNLKTNQA